MQRKIQSSIAATLLLFGAGATCTAGLAKGSQPTVQPILCEGTADGSQVGFVNLTNKSTALGISLVHEGDYGGALFSGFSSFTAGGSTASVIVTTTATSPNLAIRLAAEGSNSGVSAIYPLTPSSVTKSGSQVTVNFSFDSSKVPSGAVIKEVAIYAIQTGTSAGNVFFDSFYLNGTKFKGKLLSTGGCL